MRRAMRTQRTAPMAMPALAAVERASLLVEGVLELEEELESEVEVGWDARRVLDRSGRGECKMDGERGGERKRMEEFERRRWKVLWMGEEIERESTHFRCWMARCLVATAWWFPRC